MGVRSVVVRVLALAAPGLGGALALGACGGGTKAAPGAEAGGTAEDAADGGGAVVPGALPALGPRMPVVPGGGLPPEVVVQPSANNLDVVAHDGAVYFAFRTAPNHFASPDTVLYVLRSDDGRETWQHELRIAMGTDLREPRFLSHEGRLFLYFAVLGSDPTDFEPGGAMVVERQGAADWTAPAPLSAGTTGTAEAADTGGADPDATLIPWRLSVHEGRAMMLGYRGGAGVYDFDSGLAAGNPGIEVVWLGSEDGRHWSPWVPDTPVVHTGGGSETALAHLDDGSIVAVMRNEAGDEDGWGSKICTAPAEDLGRWTCAPDPRKYDSPLVFVDDGTVWLIARRHLSADGHYDLGMRELDHAEQTLRYQTAYWSAPKRCALWTVDPAARTVAFVRDLPSAGDTCFPSVLPLDEGLYEVWNYSSPLDLATDPSWLEGQLGETRIHRQALRLH